MLTLLVLSGDVRLGPLPVGHARPARPPARRCPTPAARGRPHDRRRIERLAREQRRGC